LVSWGVIAWLMNFIRRRTFQVFGYYRIILAVIVVVYFLWIRK
ncbi:MAG: undecaprenyl-diphosphate phosphatase, partial [Lentisphaeria bacterium]|nr:undecaprenyl-diphosphate phosphatase [Lentisphaeria bacterium]